MKMISIDDLIEYCDSERAAYRANNCGAACTALRRVAEFAKEYAVEAEPVKHGRWKLRCYGDYPYCSNCNNEPKGREMTLHCPNCGVRMDGESKIEPKDE